MGTALSANEGHNILVIGDTGLEEGCMEIKMTLSDVNDYNPPQGQDTEDVVEYYQYLYKSLKEKWILSQKT